VNTIIGEPIETSNNIVIIPISKVSFGFAAGGSEFKGETVDEYAKREKEETIQYRLPFGGGSGAAVNINPVAFLVIQDSNVKLLPINHSSAVDKLIDYVPDLMDKVNNFLNKTMEDKKMDITEEKNNKSEGIKSSIVNKEKKDYDIEYDEKDYDDDENYVYDENQDD